MRQSGGTMRSLGLPIYLPSLLFGIGQGAMVPIVAISARGMGASVALAAFAVAAMGLGKIVGDVPAGMLAARVGERRAMLMATGLVLVGLAGCIAAHRPWLLCAGLAVVGMGTAVWGLARQAFMAEAVPYHRRGRALSTLGGTQRVGLVAGPLLTAAGIGLLGVDSGYWIHVAAAALAAAVMIALREPRDRTGNGPVQANPITVIGRHVTLFRTLGLGSFLISAVRASRQALLPLWADHIGLSPAMVSVLFGLSGAMEILLFYPGGLAMDRLGRRIVAVGSMAGLCLSLLLVPLTTTALGLAAVAALMGASNGLGSGINMTIGADVSPDIGRPTFLGAWRLCADAGSGTGPLVVSASAGVLALSAAAAAVAVTAGFAAVLMARWVPRHRAAEPIRS